MTNVVSKPTALNNVQNFFISLYKTSIRDNKVLIFGINAVIKGAQGVSAVIKDSPIPKLALGITALATSVFTLLPQVPDLRDTFKLRKNLLDNSQDPRKLTTREERVANITKACTYIRDNEKTIRVVLKLGKDANIVGRARDALDGKMSLEKAEDFYKRLRSRINTKCGTELAQTICKTAGVGVSIALIAVPTSPIALGAFGIVGATALTLYGIEKVLYHNHPFVESEPGCLTRCANKIADAFNRLFHRQPAVATTT